MPNGPVGRGYIYFGLGALAASGAQVSEAHVAVYNDWSNSCVQSAAQVQLSSLASRPTTATNWNNQPAITYPSTTAAFARGDTCGDAAAYANVDATELAQRWLNVGGWE